MDYQTYLQQVTSKFANTDTIRLGGYETTVAYEEVFKWTWAATKLKIFSFIAYADAIDNQLMEQYSAMCMQYARANKKGLPIGFQNGIVSNNILVSEHVSDSAIAYAVSRPQKHYSFFEQPVIVDLTKNTLYYYQGDIVWGAMYQGFMKRYIDNICSAKH